MLQISSGKFFKGEAYETLHRAVYYTNYRMFSREGRMETPAGSLQPAMGAHGLSSFVGEIVERIEKLPGGPYPGEVISTGGDTLINDFSAIVSFALNIICTNDLDLTRRLVANEHPTLGMDLIPQKFIPRMFDRSVNWSSVDAEYLNQFVSDLMALDRESYEGVIRAIRRYVIGTHRISDDVNLAYALFVMSIESLAQNFDEFEPAWDDYDMRKRKLIDDALDEAPQKIAENVRNAVLNNEHVAIARRFREFTLDNISNGFFRDEARKATYPISRPDLKIALQQAYAIRSGYVHQLKEIPRLLVGMPGFHETIEVDGKPTLTFAGLTRVARHVIKTFVARAKKVESEEFDWRKKLPGQLTMQIAPQHWIGNPTGFSSATAQKYLDGLLCQIIGLLLTSSGVLTDIRPVLEQVEVLVPSLAKPSQRLPMLALYLLFNFFVKENLRCAKYKEFIGKYESDFNEPSIVSLAVHLLTGEKTGWSLYSMEELYNSYFSERHHANKLNLGRFLEAAFTLTLAEKKRAKGYTNRAYELIKIAVEIYPEHVGLQKFEVSSLDGNLNPIDWRIILLPIK